nr:PAS domain S-box protein [uncultured Pedobacter sp.]
MNSLEKNILNRSHPNKLMDDCGLYEISSNQQFDDILTLACFITGSQSGYISIIDENWQNIRYTKNFFAGQNPLNKSICSLTVTEGKLLQISDLQEHPELNDVVLDSQKGFKFYAGLPIIDKREIVLGTLCVLDTNSKTLSPDQQTNFEVLGKQVLNILELRKRNIQKKLSEQIAEEHRVFFDVSPSVICILNDQLEIQVINNAAFNVFGFKPDECKGLNIANFIVPEDRVRVIKLASQKLKDRVKSFDIETRIITKNNDLKWITWNAATKNRKWFIIGREITEEKEISKNLNQLSTVASKINSGIVISNAKGEVVWVNPEFKNITGYGLADFFKSKRLGDVLIGDETNKEIIKQARQDTENRKSFSVEFLAYKKNGEKIWLSVHNTVILDKTGEIDSLIEIVIDITERKESEKQLELLSLVASKTNNGVSICDKDGNVTWINEALENILGFKNEEVVGKKLIDFVKGKDTDLELLEIVREKSERFEPFNLEHKVYRKDGKEIWLSVANTSIYNKATNQYTQIEIINDITQRKQTELQLLASRESTLQLSKAKESFVSIMSHEIRTPLNAVIGLSNILYDEEKLPSQEDSINLLKFSADNLLNLINDILDFNKIEVGKMELENKRLDIRTLLKDIVDSMRFKIEGKPIKLDYSIDSNIPELVRGDKTRLYQILVNLINNAIKFTQEGSVKVIIELNPNSTNKISLNFKVIDTGIGIPADKLGAIFEPFTQAESNTSRKYGGSGLGLSITKKLVNLFGGDISVKSELGVGTEFSFELKFNKFEGPLDMVETKENIVLTGKILVVDDNEINTLLAQRVLSKFGLTIVTANRGIEAIELLKSKDFDLVLMDIHMPDLNGYETTDKLRAIDDEYYQKLPIIALTASVLEDGLDEIEKSGMTDFQLKPYNPDELVKKIAKYIKTN